MHLPYATPTLDGVAASMKIVPEDFQVDEIPSYLPCGTGEHLFVLVEKTGKDTLEVAKALARALGVDPRDVGIAGQKDRQALTTQWLSLPHVAPEAALALEGEGFRILEARLHENKLRTGHLKGNRFRIRLRGVSAGDLEQVRRIAAALEETGLPNFYGAQRFGRSGDNAEIGKRILLGDFSSPEVRAATRNGRLRRLMVSAFQSEIFNRVLAARMEAQTWTTPLAGDVLQKLGSGGVFVCEDPDTDRARIESFELSITGPLPGPKMRPTPSGEPKLLEDRIIEEAGVSPEQLAKSRDAPGTRRAFRLPVKLEIQGEDDTALLTFELPSGAYATSVIREITKSG